MDLDFRRLPLSELAAMVRRRQVSARDLVLHALDQVEARNSTVNAFVAVDGERAMAAAAALDEQLARQGPEVTGLAAHGALAGIPIAVKDLEDAEGFVTSHGSAAFAGGPPATADSPLVARLRAAGAIVIGKTNTPELGWMADTSNPTFGRTANPWKLDHSPGGSSGGTAAAVASGMVPMGTGSDGGGSIRIPSSCCGLSGLKPSLGRVPSGGPQAPDWQNLSTKGVLARRMADVVAALEVAVGPEPTDLRSLPRPEASWSAAVADPAVPAAVVWAPTLGYAPVDAEVRARCEEAVSILQSLGAEVVEVEPVFEEDPVGEWLTLTMAYNLRTLAPFRTSDVWERIDPLLKLQVEWAAEELTALRLVEAEDACHRLNLRLVELFRRARLLVTPTCAGPPPPGELRGQGLINGAVDANWVRFTYPFNMTRSPAASVCVGLTEAGLPIGLQLVGPQHADLVVIRAAAALEAAIGFDQLAPG